MTSKNFYNKLTSKLQERLGPEWTTELCTDILANNGKKKIVIAIGRRGTTIYPRISLEAYFEEYMHGKEMGKIMDMLGVISGMLEPSEKELFPDAEKIPQDMYVLTNANKINGATVMMYDSFLQRLHQKIGTFILLPSSIHEVIVYPFDKNSMSFYEYQQMVMEINQTCVLEEEVLADSVYLYDGNQILLVADENGVYYNEDDFNN